MDEQTGTLHTLARHLVLAIAPLREAVADLPQFRTLLYRLAWNADSLPPEYSALAAKVDAAVAALEQLGDSPPPDKILAVIEKVSAVYTALRAITTAPAGVDPAAFLADIGRDLFDLLIVDYLIDQFPTVHSTMLTLGIITQEITVETSTRPSVLRSRVNWGEIPNVLADPASIAPRVYGWGTNDFEFHQIAKYLLEFFVALDWPAYIGRVDEALGRGFLDAPDDRTTSIDWGLKIPVLVDNIGGKDVEIGLALLQLPPQGGKPAGMILQPLVPPEIGTAIDLTEDLRIELRAGSDLSSAFGVLLRPASDPSSGATDLSVKFPLQDGTALPDAGFGVILRYAPDTPAMLLGSPAKSRLELKGAATSFTVDLHNGQLELIFESAPQDLKLVIAPADLDGFLGDLLGSSEKTIPITLGLQWSNRSGFNFTGGAGLEVSVHPHWSLGPLRVDDLALSIASTFGTGAPPDLKAGVRATIAGSLGPISFAAEGLGVEATLVFGDGNAGPFDIEFGFKPPRGLGILVDAGPIAGGGFLSFDPDHGKYAGALELSVSEIAIKAIGFLETKLPDGSHGYSFVILISAEFQPIQLGLGFTLNGVGGLAAVHRSLSTDALQAGLRSGSVDTLLFPTDLIANAPRIISDLGTIFPAARGHYVFGPIALIGWGTPTLVEAKVGIVLELPSPVRLTLLGTISATLPTRDEAIVALHVAVFGQLDFAKRRLFIQASLYDSTIAGFPVTGDMAALVEWGSEKAIVVSVGGLNPHYEPPASFPTLNRLTIALGSGSNPRLTCQSYLAVTPNTLQFGARAELYAAAGGFNIKGWVSLDCLIQRFPLSLRADLAADVAFRRHEHVLASVHLEATITGPAPWHIWGEASLSLWMFDVSVGFDVTFGLDLPFTVPAIDPWPLLQVALEDARNWASELGASAFKAVTLASGAAQLIDPGAAATVRQSVLPLNRTLTRFGPSKLASPLQFVVDSVAVNDVAAPDADRVTDSFAAAQFDELSDTDKLSRPSFERMDAGVTIGRRAVTAGAAVGVGVEFETIIFDRPWQPRRGPRYALPLTHQLTMLQGGPSAQSPLKTTGLGRFAPSVGAPAGIALDDERYVVASTADAARFDGIPGAFGKGSALAALAAHVRAHPELTGQLQVVPEHEATTP